MICLIIEDKFYTDKLIIKFKGKKFKAQSSKEKKFKGKKIQRKKSSKKMKRFAFKMYLKKGCEKEYAKRHAAIWPELKQMIKDQGVSDYSIFWDKDTNLLFAVQKCDSDTNSQDTTNVDPITQKWWDMMADIMEVNPDNSPVSIPLEELFHMD